MAKKVEVTDREDYNLTNKNCTVLLFRYDFTMQISVIIDKIKNNMPK
jgi:hypothetical protein